MNTIGYTDIFTHLGQVVVHRNLEAAANVFSLLWAKSMNVEAHVQKQFAIVNLALLVCNTIEIERAINSLQ